MLHTVQGTRTLDKTLQKIVDYAEEALLRTLLNKAVEAAKDVWDAAEDNRHYFCFGHIFNAQERYLCVSGRLRWAQEHIL